MCVCVCLLFTDKMAEDSSIELDCSYYFTTPTSLYSLKVKVTWSAWLSISVECHLVYKPQYDRHDLSCDLTGKCVAQYKVDTV